MAIVFYDSLKKQRIKFESMNPWLVKMYTCGPTVYADAHIGNFRTYIFEDLLRRTLKFLGYEVIQVMNLTDVEDKTIKASNEQGAPLQKHTAPIIDRFFEDIDTLKIERAEFYPKATEHVPLMLDLVKKLLDKGYAYESEGSIYFRIEKFEKYGNLSGMKLDKLMRGARIDADEYEKDDFRDFALWKAWSEEDGDVGWDSPYGRGRPGWHIECSAMSMKYLGNEFDIHTGGVDNIFPHHENEIAQSECATGSKFVRYWLHSAHLMVDGMKMSKSLGNFFTLRELIEKGYPARSIRYVLLTSHYRQQINLSEDSVLAANAALERLDTLRHSAIEGAGAGEIRVDLAESIKESELNFTRSIEDDLGISGALAALFELVSAVHRFSNKSPLNKKEGEALLEFWRKVDIVLSFLFPEQKELPLEVLESVKTRLKARLERDFSLSDEIRDDLASKGYQIKDTREGTIVIWAQGRELVK